MRKKIQFDFLKIIKPFVFAIVGFSLLKKWTVGERLATKFSKAIVSILAS